jgi:superfamily II DNA/RNA helicase
MRHRGSCGPARADCLGCAAVARISRGRAARAVARGWLSLGTRAGRAGTRPAGEHGRRRHVDRAADRARCDDVVVATPGRLLDLMGRHAARVDTVEIAVIDEADHVADLGFLPAVTHILDATPNGRQCMLVSATLDHTVDRLVARSLSCPSVHAVTSDFMSIESMDHRVLLLDRTARSKSPQRSPVALRAHLFFVRTKHGADRLARQLTQHGLERAPLMESSWAYSQDY